MTTPQEFLSSFLRQQAMAYAEANKRLLPLHAEYFGDPLSQRSRDFLLRDKVKAVIESVKESSSAAVIVTREHFSTADLRFRYHLAVVGEDWKIVRIERQCIFCHGTGLFGSGTCKKCGGEGYDDHRTKTS